MRASSDGGGASDETAVTDVALTLFVKEDDGATDAADDEESHGKLVPVSEQSEFQFHLVFSNKTQTDAYCLEVWGKLTAQGVQVWQQQKNIPKDSDNWCAPPRLPPTFAPGVGKCA